MDFLPIPYPGFRGGGSKRHRITDPDLQHWCSRDKTMRSVLCAIESGTLGFPLIYFGRNKPVLLGKKLTFSSELKCCKLCGRYSVPTYQFQAENLFLDLLFLRLSLLGQAARDCRLRAAGKAAQPPATLAAASPARNSYIIPKHCFWFSNLFVCT